MVLFGSIREKKLRLPQKRAQAPPAPRISNSLRLSPGATSLFLLACMAFWGCAQAPGEFSFAVLADPHIASSPEHEQRLEICVEWINQNRRVHGIELVFVVGDIGWGPEGLGRAKEILDRLEVPYVPLLGDNEIQFGSEEEFQTVFGPQFEFLAGSLENWKKAPVPAWNPQVGRFCYLQNFSFDHKGVHFLCIDWCTRIVFPLLGEQADLHDFPGGTWPWFREDVAASALDLEENIVMISHHPMHAEALAAFTRSEYETLSSFAEAFQNHLYADFAGHYHVYWHESLWPAGYELFVTEAVFFFLQNISLVAVYREQDTFAYRHEWIALPRPDGVSFVWIPGDGLARPEGAFPLGTAARELDRLISQKVPIPQHREIPADLGLPRGRSDRPDRQG